jgi:hypothetical protein
MWISYYLCNQTTKKQSDYATENKIRQGGIL